MPGSFGKFFLPGPTEVKPDILATMTRPMISHRGSEIETMMTRMYCMKATSRASAPKAPAISTIAVAPR